MPQQRRRLAGSPIAEIMRCAREQRLLIPAFNVAYLPMVEPIVRAVKACDSFALIEVARPDIERFQAQGYAAVAEEFGRWADRGHVRLHQDHVPVIDEEQRPVDWRPLIREALELRYDAVMIDGSRLPLESNIAVTAEVVAMSHPAAAVEAELGAVLGHEPGPLPPYEELFRSKRGFTDVAEAKRFLAQTGVDWLSVSVGNVHGAIAGIAKDQRKIAARLSMEHLREIAAGVAVPLVLHGGSELPAAMVREACGYGITKINIATAVRQAYELALRRGESVGRAQDAVAQVTIQHIDDYGIRGSAQGLADSLQSLVNHGERP